MWRWMVTMMGLFFAISADAQKFWDGGAGTKEWSDAANWQPDGVPLVTDEVILSHQWIIGDYSVILPAGPSSVSIQSLLITPSQGQIILELPSTNTANPGLSLTSTAVSLAIDAGGIFINTSGASAGGGLLLAGSLNIYNGGKYIHRTARSNAALIDRIAQTVGTEKGIFEFDVPGTAGYTVSLTGNTFGSLSFRAAAAGAPKSYSGSGSGTLTIRGDLLVDSNAQVTSTLTADLVLVGSLTVHGRLTLQPTTAGTVARSLRFIGPQATLSGTGTLIFGANFRNLDVAREAVLQLQRNVSLTQPAQQLVCRGSLIPAGFQIDGPGAFILADTGKLFIQHPEGLSANRDQGPVRTQIRAFSSHASYIFRGTAAQVTGDGLPDSVSALGINNPEQLQILKNLYIRDSLLLLQGRIVSTLPHLLTLGPCKVLSPASRYGSANEGHEGSFIEGPVRLHLTKDKTLLAPVGADTVFAPIRLTKTDPGDEFRILTYTPVAPSNASVQAPLLRISDREHWILDAPIASGVKIDMSSRPWSSSLAPSEKLRPAHLTSNWKGFGEPASQLGYQWLYSEDPLTGSAGFSIGVVEQAVILPLGFLQFTVREEMNGMLLVWEADENQQTLQYKILRSADGNHFSEIGSLGSSGRSKVKHQWKDLSPPPTAYYKVILRVGSSEISTKIIRKTSTAGRAIIYPNPVKDVLNINFSFSSSTYEVEIVSLNGTVCKKFVCNTAIRQIRVDDLKRGFYLFRLKDGSDWITLPLTKD
jgi:hypothetical protein